MLILHHAWASTCSQKVRLCLAEKGLDYEGRVLNLRRFDQVSPEFLALNPDGYVPVLMDGDVVLTESTVINDYLEDRYPTPPLRPADPAGRARVNWWNRMVDEVASPSIKAPSFARNIAAALKGADPKEIEDAASRMPDPGTARRWRRAAAGAFPAEEIEDSHARLRRMLARMEATLASSPWLAGESFTLADINMLPFVARLAGLDYDLARDWPHVRDWLDRVMARPAFPAARIVEQRPTLDQKAG
jgi:glutathione S-transferase